MARSKSASITGETPSPTLAERYFRPKAFEGDGGIYAWLGVALFKRALMGRVRVESGAPVSNAYVLGARSLEAVRVFERRSRRSEAMHLAGLLLGALFLFLALWAKPLLVPGLIVVAANLHCFLLQRYNRIRCYRVLDRARRSAGNRNRAHPVQEEAPPPSPGEPVPPGRSPAGIKERALRGR